MNDILIEAKDLKKYFPIKRGLLRRTGGYIKAVDGVSLRVAKGETLGVVGETGSGKTTLGRMILNLLPADAGQVKFMGKDLFSLGRKEMKNLRREMQIIFQDPYGSLNPRMRVRDIIAEGLKNYHVGTRREIDTRVAELLDIVGLPPESGRLYPHEFSGGQRQRIGIARAIALNPAFILCDEPVSSLDVSIQAQILNLLMDLQDQFGIAYLLIAHDLSVVEHISDRVAVMYLGRIVEEAASRDLYQNPVHPYTGTLIDSIPIPDPAAAPPGTEEENDILSDPDPGSGCSFYPRCPRRTDQCRLVIPELEEIAPGHTVACLNKT
ncbi:MAG: oligopeptide/dipeptide ABC transporter ATP-binding protein [Candidatus Auribacterota bacterium]|nr:oligopeptide/dipeptide ABC transporter ATP-binding protein [Candidatus Auribacterota bacterium]